MARTRSGLGRGLGALIPGSETSSSKADAPEGHLEGAIQVRVDSIVPNPWQPRSSIPEEELEDLSASIREHGLIQPLIVVRGSPEDPLDAGSVYQLVAGERRWQAAKLAGLTEVPVIVRDVTPREMLELALVENLQRSDLNPLEEAQGFRQLMDEFGLKQEQVAERVGKSRAAVANAVRLLRLSDPVKAKIIDREISEGHARALLALEEERSQVRGLETVLKKGLNVRQTEELVRTILERSAPQAKASTQTQSLSPEEQVLENEFRQALGTKVQLVRSRTGGGRLVIQFYSEEELQNIYDVMVKGRRRR